MVHEYRAEGAPVDDPNFGEPWSTQPPRTVGAREEVAIHDKRNIEMATVDYSPEAMESYIAVRRLTAKRIVAAINVCAGIPTAQLLAQPTVSQTVPRIAELVAAATAMLAIRGKGCWCLPVDPVSDLLAEQCEPCRLRAAIAAMREAVPS